MLSTADCLHSCQPIKTQASAFALRLSVTEGPLSDKKTTFRQLTLVKTTFGLNQKTGLFACSHLRKVVFDLPTAIT